MLNESELELKNLRHVPNLTNNLISVGLLASEGYQTIFHGDHLKISKGAMKNDYDKKNVNFYKIAEAYHLITIIVNGSPYL